MTRYEYPGPELDLDEDRPASFIRIGIACSICGEPSPILEANEHGATMPGLMHECDGNKWWNAEEPPRSG